MVTNGVKGAGGKSCYKKAVLSQGGPRDAAINFVRIEVFSDIAQFFMHPHVPYISTRN